MTGEGIKVKRFILAASVALLLLGVYMGQPRNVMNKAIHICMECIGIG